MKKLMLALLFMPFLFTSCDDDDTPQVNMSVTFSGCTRVGDELYVVKGDTLFVEEIQIESLNGKESTVGPTTYFWNRRFVETIYFAPYNYWFDTSMMATGRHLLQIQSTVLQVDASPATAFFSYPVRVVERVEDIPGGGEPTMLMITKKLELEDD